jgi:hypothetical protein
VKVVVDNTKGADPRFAADLIARLGEAGFEVDTREPLAQSKFDTSVHFVVEGVSVRVPAELERGQLEPILRAVRAAEERRAGHQRYRAVPVYRGESNQVLAWVDVFA